MSDRIDEGVGGICSTCWYATATAESPLKGGRPVSSSKSRTPVEYRSERASTVSPQHLDGDDARETSVEAQVDFGHSAAPDERANLVPAS